MAQNIIVLSYSLAIAASSMIQFHHHLHNGGVHIIYSVIFETLIGEYQLSGHEHIDSGATSPEEHKDCSLTLDYFHISSNDNNILSPELFSSAIIYEHQPPILKSNTCTPCSRHYKNILTHLFHTIYKGLRSPPVIYPKSVIRFYGDFRIMPAETKKRHKKAFSKLIFAV